MNGIDFNTNHTNNNKIILKNNETVFTSNSTKHGTIQQDEVLLSNKNTKQNKAKKWFALTMAACTVAGGIACLLIKKQPSKVKILEHIDFHEAQTLKEAIDFAQKNLGIKLQNIKHLKVANFINENIVKLSNKGKGKIPLPKCIKIRKELSMAEVDIMGKYHPFTDTVSLSQDYFGECLARDFNHIKEYCPKYLNHLAEHLYHEIGHGVQVKKNGLVKSLMSLHPTKKFNSQVKDIKEDLLKFLGGEYYNYDYHCRSCLHFIDNPTEIFAQTFARQMNGAKIPDKIDKLYESIGGIIY